MTELAHTMPRNFAFTQPLEQRRTKLQDAVSGIPPATQQQEIAAALDMDKERRCTLLLAVPKQHDAPNSNVGHTRLPQLMPSPHSDGRPAPYRPTPGRC